MPTIQTEPAVAAGAQIRGLMATKRVTQAEAGAALGISQTAISRRLRGEIPFNVTELDALSKLLGVRMITPAPGASPKRFAEEIERELSALATARGLHPSDELRQVVHLTLLAAVNLLAAEGCVPDDVAPEVDVALARRSEEFTKRRPALSSALDSCVLDVVRNTRELERQFAAGRHSVGAYLHLVPIYGDRSLDVQRFMLTTVGQDEAPRCWPVTIPSDVVTFGLARLGSRADRIRLLCGLVRLYGDAVARASNAHGLRRQMLGTLLLVI